MVLLMIGSHPLWALHPDRQLTQYQQRRYGVEQGLPHPSVRSVTQDREGYIWAATEYGLARFNGNRFTAFVPNNTAAMLRPMLNCVARRTDGSLWIGSEGGGLIGLRNERFVAWGASAGLNSSAVRALSEDEDGRLWVATVREVGLWQNDRFQRLPGGVPEVSEINCLARDARGRYWVGCNRGLLGPLTHTNGVADLAPGVRETVLAIAPESEGAFWLGTRQGLWYHRNGNNTHYSHAQGLRDRRVQALHLDRQGTLWIGTAQGVQRLRHGRILPDLAHSELDYASVQGFFEDDEGHLWMATATGLVCFWDGLMNSFNRQEGLINNQVYAVAEGSSNRLWLGVSQGGVIEYREGRFRPHPAVPASHNVMTLLEDHAGRVWYGTRDNGLYRAEGDRLTNYNQDQGLASQNVTCLQEDAANHLWVGTGGGLNRWENGRLIPVPLPMPVATNASTIRCLYPARDGTLWVGANQGLFALRPAATNYYGPTEGLPTNLVYCVMEDREGRLWAGTASGLACWLDGRWQANRGHHIFWLADDGLGYLWYSSPWGIYRVKKEVLLAYFRDPQTVVLRQRYGVEDGMPSSECVGGRQPVGCQTRGGLLWFLTRRGPVACEPAYADHPRQPLRPRLERLLAQGREMPLAAANVLPPGTQILEFQYAALNYTAPERMRYRYRLLGLSDQWQEVEDEHRANFANLRPGRYQFQLQASRQNEPWQEPGVVHPFQVAPFFHQTWSFYLLCGALLVIGAGLLHGWRLRRLQRQTVRLEQLVLVRTAEIERQHQDRLALEENLREAKKMEVVGQLAAGVSHYFNNILMVIQGYAGLMRDDTLGRSEVNDAAGRIESASRRAAALVQQLLAFSRNQWLIAKPVNLNELMLGHARRSQADLPPKVELVFQPDPAVVPVMADARLLTQVLTCLTDNAVEAMPQGGSVTLFSLAVEASPEMLGAHPGVQPGLYMVLGVTDTGCGMSPEIISRLFEPFFTTKDVSQGIGLSLAAVYGIIKQHNGWIEVQSQVGVGTTLRVYLPVKYQPPDPAKPVPQISNAKMRNARSG
jgi:ligand-binding sensor domain-containing protein/signal transduction histidine kinase